MFCGGWQRESETSSSVISSEETVLNNLTGDAPNPGKCLTRGGSEAEWCQYPALTTGQRLLNPAILCPKAKLILPPKLMEKEIEKGDDETVSARNYRLDLTEAVCIYNDMYYNFEQKFALERGNAFLQQQNSNIKFDTTYKKHEEEEKQFDLRLKFLLNDAKTNNEVYKGKVLDKNKQPIEGISCRDIFMLITEFYYRFSQPSPNIAGQLVVMDAIKQVRYKDDNKNVVGNVETGPSGKLKAPSCAYYVEHGVEGGVKKYLVPFLTKSRACWERNKEAMKNDVYEFLKSDPIYELYGIDETSFGLEPQQPVEGTEKTDNQKPLDLEERVERLEEAVKTLVPTFEK